jgi:predicted nucleic acid-binding protein
VTAYVLDASVAAKWFLPASTETLAGESRRILEEYSLGARQLMVPDLFWPELGNILWKAVRQGRMSRKSSGDAIEALEASGIPTVPCLPLLPDAMAISLAFDRTVYDAVYVALAAARDALLVTADERLANSLAARFPVRWLGAL